MKLAYIKSDLFYVVNASLEIRGPFRRTTRDSGLVYLVDPTSGREAVYSEHLQAFEHWSEAAEHVAVEFDGQAERAAASARNLRALAKLHGPRP